MGSLGVRAERAAERRAHDAESSYLELVRDPAVMGARFVRRACFDRFRLSGSEVGVRWLRPPPLGSVAHLVLEGDLGSRVVCVVERGTYGPRPRFFVDGWPGAVEVYDLADLAGLVGEVAA